MRELVSLLMGKNCNVRISVIEFQKISALIIGLLHIWFFFLFHVNGIITLAIVNVVSVSCYVISYILVSKEKYVLHFRIVYSEIIIHLIFDE